VTCVGLFPPFGPKCVIIYYDVSSKFFVEITTLYGNLLRIYREHWLLICLFYFYVGYWCFLAFFVKWVPSGRSAFEVFDLFFFFEFLGSKKAHTGCSASYNCYVTQMSHMALHHCLLFVCRTVCLCELFSWPAFSCTGRRHGLAVRVVLLTCTSFPFGNLLRQQRIHRFWRIIASVQSSSFSLVCEECEKATDVSWDSLSVNQGVESELTQSLSRSGFACFASIFSVDPSMLMDFADFARSF
jgi:hypothetical protein